MVTKAKVILQSGRVTTAPFDFADKRGIAVGNKYMLNLTGRTEEWMIKSIEEVYAQTEPSVHD